MPITEQLLYQTDKSSHPRCSIKKMLFVKIFAFFTRTTCETSTQVLGRGWNKVAGRKTSKFIKKRIQHRCFPVNIAKFLLTPVFKDICVWLVLKIIKKDFLEKPPVTMIIAWAVKGQRLAVIDRWQALLAALQQPLIAF